MINQRIRSNLVFFTASIIIFLSSPQAQNHIRFNQITVEDGLSQSAVMCIFQDRKGFMWFGTQDGLNRYDGYNIKVFKNIPSDSTSLMDNFIYSIYEDRSGELYIETQSGIFHRYYPESESFSVVEKESVDLDEARFSSVGAKYIDEDGVEWTGGLSAGTGLKRTDPKTGETIVYNNDPSDPGSLSDNKVYSVFRDRTGSLWAGTFNGLDKLDERTGKFIHYRNDPADPNSLSDNWVWPIFEDTDGELWVGTVRGGICKFDRKSETFINYKNDAADQRSINDNFIFSIYEDRSGVIWIGTNTGGINYFHPSEQEFGLFVNKQGSDNTLSDNNIVGLHVDKHGDYWIATRNGGLDKYEKKNKKFVNYTNNPKYSGQNDLNGIQLIYEDRSGLLWFGTFSSGLISYNPENESFKFYKNDPSDPNSINDNRVYAILEDSGGLLWIGTYGGGLNRFDRKTGDMKFYKNNPDDTSSISLNSVWSIVESRSGELWIGTFGGGVNIFDRDKETFSNFKNDPEDESSLASDNVIRVFEDSKGRMWFGTTSGLSGYIPETGFFKNYREADGLANDFVYGIVEDDKGFLWLSTNKGLSKFDTENGSFMNYYYQDGLQGNEFNQNAFAKDIKTGDLLFGGPGGLNVFNPDSLKENKFSPPVVFTEYIRYNTDDEEGKPIFEKGISERDGISITYKDNILILNFAALNYHNNFENQYRYKLEGFNDNWIQLENNHSVTFTDLSPDEYVLKVIGSNNDGLWNETGASLFINVTPPWWRTNIAYGIYALLVFGFLYGIRKFEINRREQKAKIRETELRMKATEAEKRAIEAENERKTKELEEARQLQLSMLPKELPQLSQLEIAAFMRTASEVGGDYYDFIVQDDGTLNIAFGDATGHGLQAGTMVTLMKGFFTSDAAKLSQTDFMNHCSFMIKEIKLGRILMSFSFLRITDNKLTITSGGMPPVFYFNSVSKEIEEIEIKGMPLGAMRKFNYPLIEKELNSGDIVLLLTDGLPEQMNSNEEMFDYSRVKEKFAEVVESNTEEIIDGLVKAGDQWMRETMQADDITMVVLKIK